MESLLQDLRFTTRQLLKNKSFTLTAILSLALGIGAATAVFSVVYGVLIDPYPYKDAKRMVHVELFDKDGRQMGLVFNTGAELNDLKQAKCVDEIFMQGGNTVTMTGSGQIPVSVQLGEYTLNVFEYMGVPPLLGRQFNSADITDGKASPVAVLSYLFWKKQFNASRDVLGKTIELDHKLYTIIGVAAPRFTWGDSDVYVPYTPTGDPKDYRNSFIKLKPGVTLEAANAELQPIVLSFKDRDPKGYAPVVRTKTVTLNEQVLGQFSGTLMLLFGAVVLLLVIGCANVSILMLARGAARMHELALRFFCRRITLAHHATTTDGVGVAIVNWRCDWSASGVRRGEVDRGRHALLLVPARSGDSRQHSGLGFLGRDRSDYRHSVRDVSGTATVSSKLE